MLKFANKNGDSLGECVVSLTDLISRDITDPNEVRVQNGSRYNNTSPLLMVD